MAENNSFKTVKNSVADVVYKEKGSKFIGYLFPAENESETKEILKNLREIYPKASHHCYAYRLGKIGENYRANDCGEPSGSAGLPIYNQLVSHEITNVLLVVVRYFGAQNSAFRDLQKPIKNVRNWPCNRQ